jgi:hypothetical protein
MDSSLLFLRQISSLTFAAGKMQMGVRMVLSDLLRSSFNFFVGYCQDISNRCHRFVTTNKFPHWLVT